MTGASPKGRNRVHAEPYQLLQRWLHHQQCYQVLGAIQVTAGGIVGPHPEQQKAPNFRCQGLHLDAGGLSARAACRAEAERKQESFHGSERYRRYLVMVAVEIAEVSDGLQINSREESQGCERSAENAAPWSWTLGCVGHKANGYRSPKAFCTVSAGYRAPSAELWKKTVHADNSIPRAEAPAANFSSQPVAERSLTGCSRPPFQAAAGALKYKAPGSGKYTRARVFRGSRNLPL